MATTNLPRRVCWRLNGAFVLLMSSSKTFMSQAPERTYWSSPDKRYTQAVSARNNVPTVPRRDDVRECCSSSQLQINTPQSNSTTPSPRPPKIPPQGTRDHFPEPSISHPGGGRRGRSPGGGSTYLATKLQVVLEPCYERGQAQRFLGTHAAVYSLFNLARHLVAALHYRNLRENTFTEWERAVA